jgi:hypothetical protein
MVGSIWLIRDRAGWDTFWTSMINQIADANRQVAWGIALLALAASAVLLLGKLRLGRR